MTKNTQLKQQKRYKRFLRSKRRQASAILWVENITGAFFPFISALLLVCGAILIFQPLFNGGVFHETLSIFTFIGLGFLFWKNLKSFHVPAKYDIDKRLEDVSGFSNTPLHTLEDDLPKGEENPDRLELWGYHKHRIFIAVRSQLRSGIPSLSFSPKDPYAIGIFSILLLVIGVFVAGDKSLSRLQQGFLPTLNFSESTDFTPSLQITITPPSYTGEKPSQLSAKARLSGAYDMLEGTDIHFLYQTKYRHPFLKYGSSHDETKAAFIGLEDDLYEQKITPQNSTTLKITQYGFPRYRLPIEVKPDTPPTISLIKRPEITRDFQILATLEINDDIGIDELALSIKKPSYAKNYADVESLEFTRPLSIRTKGQKRDISEKFDTTEHPWSGKQVLLTFEAIDGRGQSGKTLSTIAMTLPEKQFKHPLSRKLISIRKKLYTARIGKRIELANQIMTERNQLSNYQGDKVIFLALSSAGFRLNYDYTGEHITSISKILWDIALKLEDGELGLALRDVQKMRQKALQTINNPNASESEKMQAIDNLQASLQKLWQEAAKDMQKRMQQMDVSEFQNTENMQTLDPSLLNDFLEQMKQELMDGDTKKADEMFSDLENLLNMLDPANAPQLSQEMRQAMEQLANLDALEKEQRELMDQTSQCAGNGDGKGSGKSANGLPSPEELSQRQGDLEGQLQGMLDSLQQLDGVPQNMMENLQNALKHMQNSRSALDGEQFQQSADAQAKALKALTDMAQNMRKQMAQKMKNRGMPMPFAFGRKQGQRDPFGREIGNQGTFGSNKDILPSEQQRKRVQDILIELRKRASEQQRPLQEKDYFKRLLQQW